MIFFSPVHGLLAGIWDRSAFVGDKLDVISVVPMYSVVLWTGDSSTPWENFKETRYITGPHYLMPATFPELVLNQEWHWPA